MFYHEVETFVGKHCILWHYDDAGAVVIEKISIPSASTAQRKARRVQTHKDIDALSEVINGKRTRRIIEHLFKRCDFSGCTTWQKEIWLCLATEVPTGQVISYGGLAEKLGRPGAARSVGSCMAHNRFPLLIPCHRVVAGNGKLGGFMKGRKDGLDIKRTLLAAENVVYIGTSLKNTEALIA